MISICCRIKSFTTSKGGDTSFAEKPELILLKITSFLLSDLLEKTQDLGKSYCNYSDIETYFRGEYEVYHNKPEVFPKKNLRILTFILQGHHIKNKVIKVRFLR